MRLTRIEPKPVIEARKLEGLRRPLPAQPQRKPVAREYRPLSARGAITEKRFA